MDLGMFVQVITAIGVIAALLNYVFTSRRAAQNDQMMLETRQAQLFMQVYNRWNFRDFTKSYGAVRYKYDHNSDEYRKKIHEPMATAPSHNLDLDMYADYQTLATFVEGLGILVKRGLIDITMVDDLFARRIIWFWEEYMTQFVGHYRQLLSDPTLYDSTEYLYNIMKQRQQVTAGNT
jgi:hypothetical protein